jgi:hypothetical protein
VQSAAVCCLSRDQERVAMYTEAKGRAEHNSSGKH